MSRSRRQPGSPTSSWWPGRGIVRADADAGQRFVSILASLVHSANFTAAEASDFLPFSVFTFCPRHCAVLEAWSNAHH